MLAILKEIHTVLPVMPMVQLALNLDACKALARLFAFLFNNHPGLLHLQCVGSALEKVEDTSDIS